MPSKYPAQKPQLQGQTPFPFQMDGQDDAAMISNLGPVFSNMRSKLRSKLETGTLNNICSVGFQFHEADVSCLQINLIMPVEFQVSQY